MEQAERAFFESQTVVVTGGAGLIGSYLVERMVEAGARAIVVDDFSKGRREHLATVFDRIEIREGDLRDHAFTKEALADANVVFHLASRVCGVGYGQGHHLEILQSNERVNDNVLDAVAASRPAHMLVTSSSCVYDDDGPDTIPELPLFDGEPEMVNWGYGWAKRFLEQKATMYAREAGIPTTIVRPFNIYGERYNWAGKYSQAIPMLVKRVMDGEDPVVVWGSGRQRRSYVHAFDCAAMMAALVARRHVNGPVNIGTEETISILDLVGLMCQVAGRSPEIVCDRDKPEGRFVKSADMSRFRSIVPDFSMAVDLLDGLQRMTAWYDRTFSREAVSR